MFAADSRADGRRVAGQWEAVNGTERFQRTVLHRWLLVSIAIPVASLSGFLLWMVLLNAYWDFWLAPKLKATDLYIYPQVRYTLFDAVLLLWCLSGLIGSGLLLWSVVRSRSITRWAYRAMVLYFVLFLLLILGGSLMVFVRSRGF